MIWYSHHVRRCYRTETAITTKRIVIMNTYSISFVITLASFATSIVSGCSFISEGSDTKYGDKSTYDLVKVGSDDVPVVIDRGEDIVIEIAGGVLELSADASFTRERYFRITRNDEITTSTDRISGEYRIANGYLELVSNGSVIERLDKLNMDNALVTIYSRSTKPGLDIFIPYTYILANRPLKSRH